jgi:hypothetical protein
MGTRASCNTRNSINTKWLFERGTALKIGVTQFKEFLVFQLAHLNIAATVLRLVCRSLYAPLIALTELLTNSKLYPVKYGDQSAKYEFASST